MKITIITLFPEMFQGPFEHSILKRAKEDKKVAINVIQLRDFGIGKHKAVDDTIYGGGVGMLLKVDVVDKAIQRAKEIFTGDKKQEKTILMDARGNRFNQQKAQYYTTLQHLIIVCGHYEGVDERIKHFVDESISIGDFVLTGGEIPAMLIADAITRLIPGVLTDGATTFESFSIEKDSKKFLEYPQYTKPPVYKNLPVPEVLLSGDHKKISMWRDQNLVETTTDRKKLT